MGTPVRLAALAAWTPAPFDPQMHPIHMASLMLFNSYRAGGKPPQVWRRSQQPSLGGLIIVVCSVSVLGQLGMFYRAMIRSASSCPNLDSCC